MAGFAQSLPFPNEGTVLQRTNLIVRWEASKHPWPKALWTYQMTPMNFSSEVISNLMVLGSFTEKDKSDRGKDGKVFSNSNGVLMMSSPLEDVMYLVDGNRADFDKNVPGTNQLFQLTTNLLPQFGINLSEIPKGKDGRPEIIFTNYKELQTAWFYRAIDGVKCDSDIGAGRIDFGQNGRVIEVMFVWRNVRRDKLYAAATPKQIVQWIREGKAALPRGILGGMGSMIPIDWSTVKKVTIKKATAYYWGEFFLGEREHRPIFPSPVIPYAVLQATIDTGTTNIDVQISCPIIDETKPLKLPQVKSK
ncbi:MAG: hypothetical protein ACREFE_13825 [Limisphaerales bacterium]